jgi:hypothetical protein
MNKKMKELQDMVLEYVTALAALVERDLTERTVPGWIVTPAACHLNWSLGFRCPGAPVGCFQLFDGLFPEWNSPTVATGTHADGCTQNGIVRKIADRALTSCLTKCLHNCCRKDPDSIWYPDPDNVLELIYGQTQAQ